VLGDHLTGIRGNVWELDNSQGNVSRKSDQGKQFIANFTFGARSVVSRLLLAPCFSCFQDLAAYYSILTFL